MIFARCHIHLAIALAAVCCGETLSFAEDVATPTSVAHRPSLLLNGTWDFRLDPEKKGVSEQWWSADAEYPHQIPVPGIWQAHGFGEPSGIVRHNYEGTAWFRRNVVVPDDWAGKRVWLRFEGICNHGDVFVNGHNVGLVETFITPYEFDVTDRICFGHYNAIACCVDSGGLWEPPAGAEANNAMTWAGNPAFYMGSYVGMMQFLVHAGGINSHVILEARPDPRIDETSIRPDLQDKTVRVSVRLARHETTEAWDGRATIRIRPAHASDVEGRAEAAAHFDCGDRQSQEISTNVALPQLHPWSPEDPFLYAVDVVVSSENRIVDRQSRTTGLRQLVATPDGNLLLNGKAYFMRGVGYDSLEPITGVPVPDKQVYAERLRLLKQYGFNYIRLLAHTPLKELFEAADEEGMFVQTEGEWFLGPNPMPEPTGELFARQVPKMIREFGHHPSWFAFSCFNEAPNINADPVKHKYVESAYNTFRELDPTKFFMASDSYSDEWPTDIITARGAMDRADAPDSDPSAAKYRSRPHIWHEFNNTYIAPLPDLEIEKRLTGVITQAWALEPHCRRMEAYGLASRYSELRQRSIDLYRNYVKWIFEDARRMPRLDGYAWWGTTNDIPAGVETDVSSLSVLDMLYRPEKFVFDEFRKFNRESVLLIDADIDQRVLAGGEKKTILVSLSHFGTDPVRNGRVRWQATSTTGTLCEGELAPVNAECWKISDLGTIRLGPVECQKPLVVTLHVGLESEACKQSNDWRFWIFPKRKTLRQAVRLCNLTGEPKIDERYGLSQPIAPGAADLVLAKTVTPEVLTYLEKGGRVLLLSQDAERAAVHRPGVIWHEDMAAEMRATQERGFLAQPGTLGYWARWIRCNAQIVEKHEALRDFPHDGFADYQLMRLYGRMTPSVDLTPANSIARTKVRPVIWALDLAPWSEDASRFGTAMTWHAMLSECRIEQGRAMLCTLYVLDGLNGNLPEAGYLLDCLVDYASSDRFEPASPPLTLNEATQFFKSE